MKQTAADPKSTLPFPCGWLRDNLVASTLLLTLGLLCFMAVIPVNRETQGLLSLSTLAVLFVLSRFFPKKGLFRLLYLACATFFVLRYVYWRMFFTLASDSLPSAICAWLLFAAELYGILMFLTSVVVNLRPIERPVVDAGHPGEECLSVDVFVPSYDEDEELLTITLIGALAMRYPREKLRVFLLDDGGTLAKRTQADPERARRAEARHHALQRLCASLGVHYLTREQNLHAKAGNLNAALPKTCGDLILILDADHVPTVDFLEKTAWHFLDDPRLFLVQTPHFFVNPDPIEKNLGLFQNMPSENLMFYGAIHPGLDFWNASFFCGSAALLRRAALNEAGGFQGESITEDAETALALHSRGWNSRYVKYPLISGLQPETFTSFIIQRLRWAQGMVQIFLLKNPLRQRGLTLAQKVSYLSNMSFWFFPFPRIIFVFSPVAYLLFGLHIYNANFQELLVYTLPYLVVLTMCSNYLFGRVRWNFISHVYELMQSMYSFGAVVAVLKNPRSPTFGVTPKSERLDEEFISPLAKPFYWMVGITAGIFLIGGWRFIASPGERYLVAVALAWNVFNFVLYAASLGALLERRQRRANPRLPADFTATLTGADGRLQQQVLVKDISVGGARIICRERVDASTQAGGTVYLCGDNPATGEACRLAVTVRAHWRLKRQFGYGISFERRDLDQFRAIVLLAHGDSRRWKQWMDSSAPDPGFLRGMWFLAKSGIIHMCRYLMLFIFAPLRDLGRRMGAPAQGARLVGKRS